MTKRNQTSDRKRNKKSVDRDSEDQKWDFKTIMNDIKFFSATHMTWKQRKELENQKVVTLGGKPPKNQRLPLSVAWVQMKRKKEREQKMLLMKEQESLILGRFGGKRGGGGGGGARKSVKRKPEDTVLKATEGHFRNGTLNVKHLLNAAPSRDNNFSNYRGSEGNKKQSGKKNKGKKKGGGRKRR